MFCIPGPKKNSALARTERKTAPGHQGFAVHADPSVTLEQDLERRDLTINAMAMDEDGAVIDPYGGQTDLKAKRLRHVSPHLWRTHCGYCGSLGSLRAITILAFT